MATTAPDTTSTVPRIWTLKVTERELTLIRIACILRLDRLKDRDELECRQSYADTRAMFEEGGALQRAAKAARMIA